MPPALSPPPYSLGRPAFPCRALAAFASRAPLGGRREVALGCYMAARLAHELAASQPVSAAVRGARATGCRAWLASLALPALLRTALTQVVDMTGEEAPDGATLSALRERTAAALRTVLGIVSAQLDAPALAELEQLAQALIAPVVPRPTA